MLTLLMFVALGAHAPGVLHPVASPRTLQCTAANRSDGKDRKCHVTIPRGAHVRSCDTAEKTAGHCTLDERNVAWAMGANGAHCELSKKKSNWKNKVAIKVSSDTKPGTGSCTLFVSVQ